MHFQCSFCPFVAKTPAHLYIHLNSHLFSMQCRFCDYRAENKKDWMKHTFSKEHLDTSRLKCPKCSRLFLTKKGLKYHLTHIHERKEYNCDECNKTYSHSVHLSYHKQAIHKMARKHCDMCEKTYSCLPNLRQHMRTHHGKQYTCDLCHEKFFYAVNLREHYIEMH